MRTLGARGYWLRHLKEEGVAPVEERYNYVYRADELTSWAEPEDQLAGRSGSFVDGKTLSG
jgi:hypothetical protein